jgi:alcohol dehydrogenase class IV
MPGCMREVAAVALFVPTHRRRPDWTVPIGPQMRHTAPHTDAEEAAMTTTHETPLTGRYNVIPLDSVLFGPCVSTSLAAECERLAISRLMLVASPSLAGIIDLPARFDEATGGRIAGVFTGGRPHVPHDVVLAATQAARDVGADGVLSVGGGSAIDLAKAIVLCLAEELRTLADLHRWRAVFSYPDKADKPVSAAPKLPHIAVSTTLSAGEFTPIIGVTDTDRGAKDIYIAPDLVPRVVVLDPELAVHTPRPLWASTGIKAVDHAVESLCSTGAQPITDTLAADALRRLSRHLPASYKDATDLYAAGQCQIGAWQSIFGLTNVSLGFSHGIAHQLGGRSGVPHGIASCVMLPAVLEYNVEYSSGPQRIVAEIFAEATGDPVELGAAELVRRFIAGLGLPTSLREVGVERSDFRALAQHTIADLIVASSPRPAAESDIVAMLDKAW